jgi:hypothetical protein
MATVNAAAPAATRSASTLISPQNIRLRQHAVLSIPFGSSQTANLLTGFLVRHLFARLQFTLTSTSTTALSAANLTGADGWSAIDNAVITINGSNQIRTLTGRQLYWLNVLTNGKPPKWGFTFGGTSGAYTATFDGTILIPFSIEDGIHPLDTCLDAQLIPANAFTLQVNMNSAANMLVNAGTVTAGNATITVSALESYAAAGGFTPPLSVLYPTFQIPGTSAGAVTKQQLQLPSAVNNMSYKGIILNVQNTSGVDSPGVLTRFRAFSGTTYLMDIDAQSYQNQYNMRKGLDPANWYQGGNPLQGTSTSMDNIDAWYYFDFAPDGYLTEAVNMANVGSFFINVDTNAASEITVIPIQLFANAVSVAAAA